MLIQVLIVDDDPIIGTTLTKMIPWESKGFALHSVVRNGAEALEVIQKTDIDIVITDIKMPVMDGLTFIKMAKQIKESIKFIVLSGFDEYPLVNEAYQLGVYDYLLKLELDPNAVTEKLQKLADVIEQEKSMKLRENETLLKMQKMERTLFLNQHTLREKLLKEFVWGTFNAELQARLSEENIHLSRTDLTVLVVTLEDYYNVENTLYHEERELFKYALSNVFDEVLSMADNVYHFCNLPHEYVILLPVEENSNEAKHYQLLHDLFVKLKQALNSCFGMVISGGFSISHGEAACKRLYRQAFAASEYSFVKGKGHLIAYRDIPTEQSESALSAEDRLLALKAALKPCDAAVLRAALPPLVVSAGEVTAQNMAEIQKLFYLYHYELLNFSKQNRFYTQLAELFAEYETTLGETGSLNQLNEWLKRVLTALVECLENGSIVNKAKEFIQNHYAERVSLSDVAGYLQISEGHLSRLFKRDASQSFTQYLIQVRIDAAIDYMQHTNLKVYEIAELVGYASTEQFSRMFKKVTGKAPKDFNR